MEKYQAVHPLFDIWHFDNSNELKDFSKQFFAESS